MLNVFSHDTQRPFVSLAEICGKTGFTESDCLIELERKDIAPIHFGNGVYLTENDIVALFSQNSGTDFVSVQPIFATTLDNSGGSELPLAKPQNDEEVRRVGKATISKVSDTKRKKPYLVQWRIYFADSTSERKSKSFATRKEAESFADELNKKNSPAEQPHTELDTYRGIDSSTPFVEYAEFYVLYSGQLTCGDRTKRDYIIAINLFRKHLCTLGRENITLGEMDDTLCNRVFKEISKCCAQATLNKVYILIKRVLKYAFDKRILTGSSYVNLIVKHKSSVVTKEREPYTKEEVDAS